MWYIEGTHNVACGETISHRETDTGRFLATVQHALGCWLETRTIEVHNQERLCFSGVWCEPRHANGGWIGFVKTNIVVHWRLVVLVQEIRFVWGGTLSRDIGLVQHTRGEARFVQAQGILFQGVSAKGRSYGTTRGSFIRILAGWGQHRNGLWLWQHTKWIDWLHIGLWLGGQGNE